MKAIGFIGFGEVGRLLARGLADAGAPPVFAWDIELEDPGRRDRVVARVENAGAAICLTPGELSARADLLVSAVVSSSAVAAARSLVPHLGQRHLYLDLNSTSPVTKQEVGRVVEVTGARFVEGAVMAAVPALGLKVPILLCGAAASEVVASLTPYGMSLEDFGPEIGRATATKMFRSVVVKGLEALLLECALGAERYGVTERVLAYVEEGYPGLNWNRLAHFLLGRTAIHGGRRGHEMFEAAETLRATGVEPLMAEAAAKRLLKAASQDLKRRFEDRPPETYHEVIRAIDELFPSVCRGAG